MWSLKEAAKKILGKDKDSFFFSIDAEPEELIEIEEISGHENIQPTAVLSDRGVEQVAETLPAVINEPQIPALSYKLYGWAFSLKGPVWIEVCVDSQRIACVECGSTRPDVFRVHPGVAWSFSSGFTVQFPSGVLELIGPNRVEVFACNTQARQLIWTWNGGTASPSEEETKIDELKRFMRLVYNQAPQVEQRKAIKRKAALNIVLTSEGNSESTILALKEIEKIVKVKSTSIIVPSEDFMAPLKVDLEEAGFSAARPCTLENFGSITSDGSLYLFLSDQISLDALDVAKFIEDYVDTPQFTVLAPLVFSLEKSFPVPPVGNLKRLRACFDSTAGIPVLATRDLPDIWLSSADFLANIQNSNSEAVNNSFVFPPKSIANVYHISAAHAVYSSSKLPSTLSVAQKNGLDLLYSMWDFSGTIFSTSEKCAYFVYAEEPGCDQTRRAMGYMCHEMLKEAESAGYEVILVSDSASRYTDREHLGRFACYTLSDVARQSDQGEMHPGPIIAFSWRGVPAAYTLKYLVGGDVSYLAFDAMMDEANADYDVYQKARLVALSDTVAVLPDQNWQGQKLLSLKPENANVVLPPVLNKDLFSKPEYRVDATDVTVLVSMSAMHADSQDVVKFVNAWSARSKVYPICLVYDDQCSLSEELLSLSNVRQVRVLQAADYVRQLKRSAVVFDLRKPVFFNFESLEARSMGIPIAEYNRFVEIERERWPQEVIDLIEKDSVEPVVEQDLKVKTLFSALTKAFDQQEKLVNKTKQEERPLSIVVPIYNALDAVIMCVDSILKTTSERHKIILVNDASDSSTSEWLRELVKAVPRIKLVEHPENKGFVEACWSGLLASDPESDLLLINSDLVLTQGCVERMIEAAYSSGRVGIVSVLSTGSSHLQVDMNPGDSLENAARTIAKGFTPTYPTVITPEGQCMYLRRNALDRFGFFDHVFGKGYCEESDLSMRMFCHGVDMIVADNALVSHRKAASFGASIRKQFYEKNRRVFDERWGQYYLPAYQKFVRQQVVKPVRDFYSSTSVSLAPIQPDFTLESLLTQFESVTANAGRRAHVKRVLKDAEVVFVLPRVLVGGGSYSVLQHVNEMLSRGINAKVVALMPADSKDFDFPLQTGPISVSADQFFDLDWSNQKVIATFWLTAYYVKELERRFAAIKGYYYIQDYEPWFYSRPENFRTVKEAAKTYELGLHCVAKTNYLAHTVKQEHNVEVDLVTPGLARTIFYPGQQDQYVGRPRLAALFRSRTTRRGYKEMLVLVERLLDRIPELDVSFFGDLSGLPEQLNGRVNLLGRLSQDQVAKLYRNSDIVLDMSYWHGFGRMGIEGMASGAVPALTYAGGVEQYAVDGENAVLFEVGDYDSAVSKIIKLAKDREYRLALRRNGLASVVRNSEGRAVDDWLKILNIQASGKQSAIAHIKEPGSISLVKNEEDKDSLSKIDTSGKVKSKGYSKALI